MDNFLTLIYVVKVTIYLIICFILYKTIRVFFITKINVETESNLLEYIFKNYTILDFDDNIVIFDKKNKIDITNDIYHITITYDDILHTYNYIVDDIYFNSQNKYSKLTIDEYNNIKSVIKKLGLDKYKVEL